MKISISILLMGLKEEFPPVSYLNLQKGLIYENISVGCPPECPENTILLCSEPFPPEYRLSESCCAIFPENVCTGELPKEMEYIRVKSGLPFFSLVNRVYGILAVYHRWQETMQRILLENRGLQELFDAALPIFENPVFYVDESITIRAYSEYHERMDVAMIYGAANTQTDYVYQLKNSPKQLKSFLTQGPTLWEADELGEYSELYCNIFREGEYIGRIFVDARLHDFTQCDYDNLELFAEYVSKAVKERQYLPYSCQRLLEQQLVKLLQGDEPNRQVIENELRCLEWDKDPEFILTVIQTQEKDRLAKTVIATCNRIETELFPCRAFPFNDRILVLTPIHLWKGGRQEFQHKLQPLVIRGNFKAAMSDGFSNIFECSAFLLQSEAIEKEGMQSAPEKTVYTVGEFILPHILKYGTTVLPFRLLCSPGLKRLFAADRARSADYASFLQTYLDCCCSPSEASRRLFLARSTFLRKLERVETMLDMPLTDSEYRLYLSVMLHLQLQEDAQDASGVS